MTASAARAETLRLLGTPAPSTVAVTIELRHDNGSSSRQMFGTVREAIHFLESRDAGRS